LNSILKILHLSHTFTWEKRSIANQTSANEKREENHGKRPPTSILDIPGSTLHGMWDKRTGDFHPLEIVDTYPRCGNIYITSKHPWQQKGGKK